jgi:hypothetical protein
MNTDRLIAKAAAFGVAAFFTLSILAGIDRLATEEHAGTAVAAAAAAAAKTAAAKAPAAPRS